MWQRAPRTLLMVLSLYASAAPGQQTITQVTTTSYQRNADGALTAVTMQVDNGPATTTYLTWDNFLPNVSDPTTGTVSPGNGNLLGYGPSPGGAYTTQLRFDQRNRLTSANVVGTTGVTYAYYAASGLSSATLSSGDALQFYYDTARNQVATNIYQQSSGTWSSYLDQTAYLSDGTEQVRFQPRKDVAGQYANATQNFSAVSFDPYGAAMSPSTPPTSAYDMTQNPFRYAGEFNDPVWGGYYLRARWYLPAMETFVSRDPGDIVRRYSYADADPISNTDPSGLRSGFAAFQHDLRHVLKPLMSGPVGFVAPLFIGSELTALEILANPAQFWRQIRHDSQGTDIFLAASIVAEVGSGVSEKFFDYAVPFRAKVGLGAGLGAAQSVTAGLTTPSRRGFNLPAFGQSLEYAVNSQFNTRYSDEKVHFNKMLSADKVNDIVTREFDDPAIRSVEFRAYPNRPTGPIEAWWHRITGTPQKMYEVSILRERWDTNVSIKGDASRDEFAEGGFDPLLDAAQNIQATGEKYGIDLRNSRYERMGHFYESDEAVVERRAEVSGTRPKPLLRSVWSGCVFTLIRIRGWVSLVHF